MFLPRSGWSPDLASSGLTTCEFPLTDESSGTSSQFQGLRTWSERWLQTSRPSTLENRWTVVLTPSSQTGDPINRIQTASSLPCSTLSLADIPSPLCGNVSYHGPEALLDSYVTRDWRRVSLLLCLAELLSARRLGYPPLSPAGVGLGASVREVTHVNPAPTVRTADLPIKPFDVFFSLRIHTYTNSLLQLEGTCGPRGLATQRILTALFSPRLTDYIGCPDLEASGLRVPAQAEFVSRSTQTCICGLLEWDSLLRAETQALEVPFNDLPQDRTPLTAASASGSGSSYRGSSSITTSSGRVARSRSGRASADSALLSVASQASGDSVTPIRARSRRRSQPQAAVSDPINLASSCCSSSSPILSRSSGSSSQRSRQATISPAAVNQLLPSSSSSSFSLAGGERYLPQAVAAVFAAAAAAAAAASSSAPSHERSGTPPIASDSLIPSAGQAPIIASARVSASGLGQAHLAPPMAPLAQNISAPVHQHPHQSLPPLNHHQPQQQQQQLGGVLAFHPFPPSHQHQALYHLITVSSWTRAVSSVLASFDTPTCSNSSSTGQTSTSFVGPSPGTTSFISSTTNQWSCQRLVYPIAGSGECPACASNSPTLHSQTISDKPSSVSATQSELQMTHQPRSWIARDACVDTSELRCFTGPIPQVLTICQPINMCFSHLTSIHLEKVGISHLVLSCAPRLKNITLENCPELAAILIHPITQLSRLDGLPVSVAAASASADSIAGISGNCPAAAAVAAAAAAVAAAAASANSTTSSSGCISSIATSSSIPVSNHLQSTGGAFSGGFPSLQLPGLLPNTSQMTCSFDPLPALRRVRIIRCPKFAIYHWLYTAALLYPEHDENLFITFRPFGHYNAGVERALWHYSRFAHVMISHDFKQHESERVMEEFHSSFDQLFREVMNFSDVLIRGKLVNAQPIPTRSPQNHMPFTRSEQGPGWDLLTDVPWVHEVCCSLLPSNTLGTHTTTTQPPSGCPNKQQQPVPASTPVQSSTTPSWRTEFCQKDGINRQSSITANSGPVTRQSSIIPLTQASTNQPEPSIYLPRAPHLLPGHSANPDSLHDLLNEAYIGPPAAWLKLQRRGIHLHVQFRDVHGPSPSLSHSTSATVSTPHVSLEHSECKVNPSSVSTIASVDATYMSQPDESQLSAKPFCDMTSSYGVKGRQIGRLSDPKAGYSVGINGTSYYPASNPSLTSSASLSSPASSLYSLLDWPPVESPTSYLVWPYTDAYLAEVHPGLDLNAWGDAANEAWYAALPPRPTPRPFPVHHPALMPPPLLHQPLLSASAQTVSWPITTTCCPSHSSQPTQMPPSPAVSDSFLASSAATSPSLQTRSVLTNNPISSFSSVVSSEEVDHSRKRQYCQSNHPDAISMVAVPDKDSNISPTFQSMTDGLGPSLIRNDQVADNPDISDPRPLSSLSLAPFEPDSSSSSPPKRTRRQSKQQLTLGKPLLAGIETAPVAALDSTHFDLESSVCQSNFASCPHSVPVSAHISSDFDPDHQLSSEACSLSNTFSSRKRHSLQISNAPGPVCVGGSRVLHKRRRLTCLPGSIAATVPSVADSSSNRIRRLSNPASSASTSVIEEENHFPSAGPSTSAAHFNSRSLGNSIALTGSTSTRTEKSNLPASDGVNDP